MARQNIHSQSATILGVVPLDRILSSSATKPSQSAGEVHVGPSRRGWGWQAGEPKVTDVDGGTLTGRWTPRSAKLQAEEDKDSLGLGGRRVGVLVFRVAMSELRMLWASFWPLVLSRAECQSGSLAFKSPTITVLPKRQSCAR